MDAFVHASGDGFGNTAPLRSDTGAIDMDAISQVAHVTQGAGKLTRKEKKHAKREMKRRKKEAKKAEKEAKKTYSSIKSQLKDRDKELSDKMADARKKRDSAKDVVNYIGYNKMYQDGICEVEEGMFSSSIAFDDTSYHSVRDEQQKAMFSAITRLYDQFGADERHQHAAPQGRGRSPQVLRPGASGKRCCKERRAGVQQHPER